MLPTGHIAGGYIIGYALLKFAHPAVSQAQSTQLLWWAVFFGFAPDLDTFFTFFRQKSLLVVGKGGDHRRYYSHAPFLWLLAGLLIYFLSASPYFKFFGLMVWLGSWSHFLLDSIDYGIMWLWPFSGKLFALKKWTLESKFRTVEKEKNFFFHTWQFLKFYSGTLSFYLELIVIISAVVLLLTSLISQL